MNFQLGVDGPIYHYFSEFDRYAKVTLSVSLLPLYTKTIELIWMQFDMEIL